MIMHYVDFIKKAEDWVKIQDYKVINPKLDMATNFEIWVSPDSEIYLIEIWGNSIKVYKNCEL